MKFVNETGASLTEFTLFLPVWGMLMIGIINLGQLGIDSTGTILTANSKLWVDAVEVNSTGWTDAPPHRLLPTAAGLHKTAELGLLVINENNDQQPLDLNEEAHAIALGAGHFGESAVSTVRNYQNPMMLRSPDFEQRPERILGDREYPNALLNDQLGEVDFSTDIVSTVFSAVSGSGLMASTAAGIRYGDIFASHHNQTKLLAGAPKVTSRAHFDMLVAPFAISSEAFTTGSTGLAWFAARNVEYYNLLPRFGNPELQTVDGAPNEGQLPETETTEIPESLDKRCKREYGEAIFGKKMSDTCRVYLETPR